MTDVVVKGFRRRQAAGEMLFNKMTKFDYTAAITGRADITLVTKALACGSPSQKGIYRTEGNWGLLTFGIARCQNAVSDQAKGRLTREVETKVLAERKAGQTNLIESFAELDQVWHMVRNPLDNLWRFLIAFEKEGKRRKPRQGESGKIIYDFARNEWLRFRYGISPIMRDVSEVMKAMSKGHPKRPIRVKSKAQGQIAGATKLTSTYADGNLSCVYRDTWSEKFSIQSSWYDVWQPTVFSDVGINLVNVAAVGWELTRFSFVVDWFANVGDFIYANIPRSDVQPVGGSSTTITELLAVRTPENVTNINTATWDSITGSVDGSYCRQVFKSRIPGINPPGLVIKADFRFDHWRRCADLVSLIPPILSTFAFHTDPKWRYDDV
jgi:hypothetical protein